MEKFSKDFARFYEHFWDPNPLQFCMPPSSGLGENQLPRCPLGQVVQMLRLAGTLGRAQHKGLNYHPKAENRADTVVVAYVAS